MNNFRNRLAWRIANFALNHIADKRYRDGLDRIIKRGIASTISRRALSEAEQRVLDHGVTAGCPLCEEAAEHLSSRVPVRGAEEEVAPVSSAYDQEAL